MTYPMILRSRRRNVGRAVGIIVGTIAGYSMMLFLVGFSIGQQNAADR